MNSLFFGALYSPLRELHGLATTLSGLEGRNATGAILAFGLGKEFALKKREEKEKSKKSGGFGGNRMIRWLEVNGRSKIAGLNIYEGSSAAAGKSESAFRIYLSTSLCGGVSGI